MANTTYFSPIINDAGLPSDGYADVQPDEILPKDTITSPVIPDKTIFGLDAASRVMSSNDPNQYKDSMYPFGNGWLIIDNIHQRLIIHDGDTDRILIGRY